MASDLQLELDDLADEPMVQFRSWFDAALAADLPEPTAMTLATATPDGLPSARIVLLKGADERGFTFYTNYTSRKAAELEANPRAALVLHWAPLQRQVRVAGRVARVGEDESDAYFATRPRGSRIGAWASPQSQPLVSRSELIDRVAEAERRFDNEPPRPPFWGGYRLTPETVEFWQARTNRLHDRFVYRRAGSGWEIQRLAP
ncbi:MAG: pyridoxamine 5'-phosphate oxidase [Egibacteraceae bacterium]